MDNGEKKKKLKMKTNLTNCDLVKTVAAEVTLATFAVRQIQTVTAKSSICRCRHPAV